MRLSRLTVGAVTVSLIVAACGDGEAVSVEGPWARTSPAMTSAGAVYMDLTAEAADRLIGVSIDPSIAATAEIHETVMADMGTEGESEEPAGMGAMRMQQVEGIDLPAGATVSLEPGGYHIMLIDLTAPLVLGERFDVTLDFAESGTRVVTVEVRDDAP
jgi:copper(I)-binding protein